MTRLKMGYVSQKQNWEGLGIPLGFSYAGLEEDKGSTGLCTSGPSPQNMGMRKRGLWIL